jgi:AmmeMemoRadiSam system protein A
MQNSPACGIFSIFLFSKILTTYNQIKEKKKSKINIYGDVNNDTLKSIEKTYKLYPRLVCYYTSLQRLEINIYNFNPYQCFKTLDINNSNESSVSYGSLIFTTQPYISKHSRHIESLMTQFEKLSLLSLAREHLYIKLSQNYIPNHLIFPISAPVFKLPLGVFCTINTDQDELRGCVGTTDTYNLENTIETNVKKFIQEAAFKDSRFNPLEPFEYNRIQLSLTILYKLKKISITDYFKKKFILGKNGILINYNNSLGYFLPSVAIEFNYDKKELLEELCKNKIGLLTKQCYLDQNVQLYFNEGYEFSEKDFL